jgi:hypothetical protein
MAAPEAAAAPAEQAPPVPETSRAHADERGETAREFMALQAASEWRPPPRDQALPLVELPPVEVPEPKRKIFRRTKKPKVKVSSGFEYTVPPRGSKKPQQPTVTVGPAAEARREINCPRCGQPSPRGLCEACEDALSQLRQLTVAFLDE